MATMRATGEGSGSSVAVTLSGSAAGVPVGGAGTLTVEDDLVDVHSERGNAVVEMSKLEGVTYRDSRLTLFLAGGDRVHADGTARLAAVAREIASNVCTLPELTRPLRSLGSRRGKLGADHDRFFAPLLTARRKGERAADRRARLRAFDGAAMSASLDTTIADFAKARFPRRAPERRAIEAELLELAAPLRTALEALDTYASRAIEEGSDETAFVRWRSWCGAVQEVFDRADRCWLEFGPVLGDAPVRRPLWRRMLRLR
jgi:hypothetical protein